MSEQRDRVVLAYSGGLDTSVCIKWMQEELAGSTSLPSLAMLDRNTTVSGEIHDKALRTGAIECRVVDMRGEFAGIPHSCLPRAISREQVPARVALSRPLIAKHLVESRTSSARSTWRGCRQGQRPVPFRGVHHDAHSVAGNHRPLFAKWDLKTRPQEMDWAAARGVEVPPPEVAYSIERPAAGPRH